MWGSRQCVGRLDSVNHGLIHSVSVMRNTTRKSLSALFSPLRIKYGVKSFSFHFFPSRQSTFLRALNNHSFSQSELQLHKYHIQIQNCQREQHIKDHGRKHRSNTKAERVRHCRGRSICQNWHWDLGSGRISDDKTGTCQAGRLRYRWSAMFNMPRRTPRFQRLETFTRSCEDRVRPRLWEKMHYPLAGSSLLLAIPEESSGR